MAKYIKTEEGYKTLDSINSVASKMDATNPVGSGSFSMNRKVDTTIGDYSHAEGYYTEASSYYSHAEGYYTTASNIASHAEGSLTKASGECSHAEGSLTEASGEYSHTEGNRTKALGYYSHAEGSLTKASGECSHAEGINTTASGYGSHAEGYDTTASGSQSHVEGVGTTASGKYQHVQGVYNINDVNAKGKALNTYAHIVGNGTSDTKRSNAHTLDWGGNAWYAGDVYVGSASGTNKDDGSKKLATEEYVDAPKMEFILKSSTEGSTKKFKLTIDDDGVLTATEIVESEA